MERFCVSRGRFAHSFDAGLELLGDMATGQLGTMAVKAQVPEVGVLQAIEDDFERRPLLGDEQHGLATSNHFRDEIGDGLALSCARWAADNAVLSGERQGDGLMLRRIGVANQELLVRTLEIERGGIDRGPITARVVCRAAIAGDTSNEIVASQWL